MEKKLTILLAEDDDNLSDLIKDELEDEGYKVIVCSDGQTAIEVFDKDKFDLCLLDIMMPVKDGFTVAKKIRQKSDVIPILFISTRAHLDDKTEGYMRGGDDYIVKPFAMKELLMKMDVFLRRTKKMFSETRQEFNFGNVFFSYTDLLLKNSGGTFSLKQKEADLLLFLATHPNRILKREEILVAVWGKDDYFLGRSMDVFMSKLRKYMKDEDDVTLETIHRIGYRFVTKITET